MSSSGGAKSRNFRRRSTTISDDPDPTPTTISPPPKPKPKKQTLLSFADDEDTFSPPIIKKPTLKSSSSSATSSSNKFTKPSKDRPSAGPSLSSLNRPSPAGSYTKEALLELQKNTKTLSAPKPLPTRPAEPVVLLKGLFKPRDNNEDEDEEEEEDDEIMDKARIDAARAKRERMRQAGVAAPDYISLDQGSNHGEAEGVSDEEPEFRGRIGLIGEKGKKGVFDDVEESPMVVENDEEEEEAERIWAEEQVRKGLGKRRDDGVAVVESGKKDRYAYRGGGNTDVMGRVGAVGGELSIGGFPGSNVLSITQQAEVTKKALLENVTRLKESHGRTLASLSITDENMSASVMKVTSLEKALTAAGEKFIFMQKLREFVSVICEFLQYKAPYIEELEAELQKLQEERASSMLERRSADNEDEMIEIEAAVNAAMSVFNKGVNSSIMVEMATKAAQAASAKAKDRYNLPVKLDEFDRDINLQKRMDITRRSDARKKRKARSDAKRSKLMDIDGPQQRIEGESSTDESDSEISAYQSNKDMLFQTADQIFSDTVDEYSQLSAVIEKFEIWKKDYPASYQDAYMPLSIPSIFSPYVRLELLKWDPLHKDTDFIDMNWHSLLYNYGIEDEDNINPDDADANLIPHLVEKVALPILHHSITQCWDILSTKETNNAVTAMELVIRYLPAASEALVDLVSVLRDRIADAVAKLMVPTWSPLAIKAVPNAGQVAAYRFGTSVRLLKNICKWNRVLALPVLENLALDDLLSGKILPHLRSIQGNVYDAITRTERVIASLSGVWSGQNVAVQRSLKLQPLVNYLLSLGRILEKKHGSEGENGLPLRLKKMLVELNEYDHARAISRTFNLKAAL